MALVKEKGTIAIMGEVQSGSSQSGNKWSRQQVVVDVEGYNGTYRKVMLQASGNLVMDMQSMMVGDKVEVTYQVTAREWNGKWYNNVDLYKIEAIDGQAQQPVTPAAPAAPQQVQPQQRVRGREQSTPLVPPGHIEEQEGDLPF